MKYEFHVGDYVVYSDKYKTYKGYVKEYMNPKFSNQHYFTFQWDDGSHARWCGRMEDLPHNFIRIGQYDFTKANNKIEPLPKEYNDLYNKINELVEVVNRLEEKVNET